MIQYNFRQTRFFFDEEGALYVIWISRPELSEKAGDYPVISEREAREFLEEGEYLTASSHAVTGGEEISGGSLMYPDLESCGYFMPYYRFYVKLPEEKGENGRNVYGIYYVPAVDRAFLTDPEAAAEQ